MTDQELFDAAAYALMSGGSVMFERGRRIPSRTAHLLADLQRIETDVAPEAWPAELQRLAGIYNLKMPE
jgi:hypothetical protein